MHDLTEEVLAEMDSRLSVVVTREELSEVTGKLISPRSFANRDSLNRGVGAKVKLGRKVAYPKRQVMEWLRANLTIEVCE